MFRECFAMLYDNIKSNIGERKFKSEQFLAWVKNSVAPEDCKLCKIMKFQLPKHRSLIMKHPIGAVYFAFKSL